MPALISPPTHVEVNDLESGGVRLTALPLGASETGIDAKPARQRLDDRLLGWRDALLANATFQRWAARFPLTRPIARRRSRALFDLCAGFVYSQVLRGCVELRLFEILRDGPLDVDTLSARTAMPAASLERLIGAAMALDLLERRSAGRIGLGSVGAPLAHNEGLEALISHHALLYEDLQDPIGLLRTGAHRETSLSRYYPYAAGNPEAPTPEIDPARAASYSRLMSATAGPLISEILDAYSFERHTRLLDVGGGEGRWARALAERWPHLSVTLFDLPAVARRAESITSESGLGARVSAVGGDFHQDALPTGMDAVTLVRVLLDHGDDAVLSLLRRVREALVPGGRLLIVEPMAGVRGARAMGDAYFAMYLFAMGAGRARSADELTGLCRAAGFSRCRRVPTNYPISTGILVADR